MSEISFKFLALRGSRQIRQAPAFSASLLSIAGEAQCHHPLTIIGVTLNGRPLQFRPVGPLCVAVSPAIPLEGDRIEVHCLAPEATAKAPVRAPATNPLPPDSYGLQAPECRKAEESQWHSR